MGKAGRPTGQLNPARARVLTYWRKHGPCPLQQVVRATGVERSRLKRIMASLADSGYLGATGGDLEMIGEKPIPKIDKKLVGRFFSHVDRTTGFGPKGDCWLWTGSVAYDGYPRSFTISDAGVGRKYRVSHVSLIIAGHLPDAQRQLALHSCDNPVCVNPAHLRWGTALENLKDYIQRRPKKAALQEHEVRAIRASVERHVDLAVKYGVSPSAICLCRQRVTHKHVD